MRKATFIGHQGDIHIRHLGAGMLPPEAIEIHDADNFIVAIGEATGHRHRVVGQHVRFFRAPDGLRAWALVQGDGAQLLHDSERAPGVAADHGTHYLAPGLTEFRRKREATLNNAGWQTVND